METLTAIKKVLDRILIWLCIFFCGFMVVLVSYQVIARFIFHNPSAISEEAARICFVWMGLLASAMLYGEKGHMNINFVPEKFGPYWSKYLTLLSEVLTLGMAVWVLTWGGYHISLNGMGQTNSAMTWLRVGVIYSVVPISGVCVVFYAIYNILDTFKKIAAYNKEAVNKNEQGE